MCRLYPPVTVPNRMCFPLSKTEEQCRAFSATDCIFTSCCILDCFVQCETASFQGHIPIFALNFQWQYRHLVRDRAGKIIEGSEVWTTVWCSVCGCFCFVFSFLFEFNPAHFVSCARPPEQSSLKNGQGVVIVRRDIESDVFNWKVVDLKTWATLALL